MSTTSGRSLRAEAIASCPSLASPTTVVSGLAVQDFAQSDPDQCLVVGDEDRGHVSGSKTWTVKPPPGEGPASNLPPYRLTRSRIPTRP